MSIVVTITCSANWDRGLPCRASLPIPAAAVTLHTVDMIDPDAARNIAFEHGWRQEETTGRDLCPSHVRAQEARRAAVAATVTLTDILHILTPPPPP